MYNNLVQQGVSDPGMVLKAQGRWKSDCYRVYVRVQREVVESLLLTGLEANDASNAIIRSVLRTVEIAEAAASAAPRR